MVKSVSLYHSIRPDHLAMNNNQEKRPGVHRSPGYNHGTLVTLGQKWQIIMRVPPQMWRLRDVGELDAPCELPRLGKSFSQDPRRVPWG